MMATYNDDSESEDKALAELRREEEEALHDEALEREKAELTRRRSELVEQINGRREDLTREWQKLQNQLEELGYLEKVMEEVTDESSAMDSRSIHPKKKRLREVEMRLLAMNKDEAESQAVGARYEDIVHRPFFQLSRVGIALSWPFLLGLFINVFILVAVLIKLFHI